MLEDINLFFFSRVCYIIICYIICQFYVFEMYLSNEGGSKLKYFPVTEPYKHVWQLINKLATI